MGTSHPILGYPSKTACALALREKGRTNAQIAAAMGMRLKDVASLIRGAIVNGQTGLGQARNNDINRTADNEIFMALCPHANVRGMSVDALRRKLLQIIVEDDMVDAVLDDGFCAVEEAA